MSDTGRLLGEIAAGFFQQAFVVADLAAAEEPMRRSLGCGAFVDLPATDLEYELRGTRVSAALALGFARSGNVQIELIEPVRGEGLHAEFLASNGPGAHHLGFLVEDLDATVALAQRCSFPRLMGGEFGTLRFCYVDTWAALGLFTELVEDPDGTMMSLMPWRG
jgi:catechol 2,3-dioxygenase-like lactoylglutathione lyase family enzyme